MVSRIGDQLSFEGFEEPAGSRVPWGGISPRELTAAYKRSILKAQAAKSTSEFVWCDQLEMWPTAKKGPGVYTGARLLISLEGRRYCG